jgi:hypothetical protein
MGTPAAKLPPAGDAVPPVDGSCSPRGCPGASHEANRVLPKYGPSHVRGDPATDDRVRGAAHARIPADRAIDRGELLDDLHPRRPLPFLASGASRDQRAEEAESRQGFHHRLRQLARRIRLVAVLADERAQLACTVEFLLEAPRGCRGMWIGHTPLLL